MKNKSLSILIAVALATTTILPAASVFAATTPVAVTAAQHQHMVLNTRDKFKISAGHELLQLEIKQIFLLLNIAGTVKKGLRVEALKVTGTNLPAGATITYQGQVQNIGWQAPVTTTGDTAIDSAALSGTVKRLRVEAFKITLSGLPGYAVAYQVQVQNKGWMTPVQTENGTDITTAAVAGTQKQGLRMEALRIELVKTTTEKTSEIAAINAVQVAETSGLATDIASATTAVTAVQDTVENAALTTRIAAIQVAATSADLSAANTAITTSGTALASYTAAGGLNTDAVYTAVSTASTTLQADIGVAAPDEATVDTDTAALTAATTNLTTATTTLTGSATLNASIVAANTAISNVAGAQASYTAAGGLNTDAVYTAVSTASTTLQADIALASPNAATINADTATLTAATTALTTATSAF